MQWKKDDIETYIHSKEYIDTIIMPLEPFHLSNDDKLPQTTYKNTVLHIFADALEKELSGRTMRTPSYTYLDSGSKEEEARRLEAWANDIKKQPFEDIFLLTFDISWKKIEEKLPGQLIWLPLPLENATDSDPFKKWIQENVLQVSELIRSYW